MDIFKCRIILFFCWLLFYNANSQVRVITTGVPFISVAADAKAAGMANIGIATPADAFSQQWNSAKYTFSNYEQGLSVSYTPYLSELSNDISLGQLTYYKLINYRSAWAASMRFFGLGDIKYLESSNDLPLIVSPNELAIDGSYSLRLSNSFSMGITGRFISSNLKIPSNVIDASAANTFCVDVAGFYQSDEISYNNFNGIWRHGFNIQNLGPKISYDRDAFNSNFLPSNLKIGSGFEFIFNEDNRFQLNVELNKLLIPSLQNSDLNGDGIATKLEITKNRFDYQQIGWVSGLLKSFSDAPNGISEELEEFTYAFGAEYTFKDSFRFRTGYFYESPNKGARRFLTLGLGFNYSITTIDLSYLFSTSTIFNPLDKTLRFSITFNLGNLN